jgi:hypothetical protein
MKIDCQECGARILAADLDLPTSMAKCRNCNAVFSFADRLQASPPVALTQRERLRTPRPEGLTIRETSDAPTEPGYRDAPRKQGSITVVRRWFSPVFIFLALFCCIWDGFLFFWYSKLTSGPAEFAILAGLFPILHVAVGVGLTYYTIAGFVNRTTLRLDERFLSVRHAPLPWKGNHTIARENIKQLYCEHEVTQGKNGASHSYYLSAVLMDEHKVRLASMPVDQAKYIEDIFEERLGIADMYVPGEVGRAEG